MAGVSARLEFNSAPLSALLARLHDAASEKRPVLDAVGGILEANTKHRFETGKGPGGASWKQSLRVRLFGGQTLRDHGNLMASISYQVTDDAVEWGTADRRARIHQFGGTIVPKGPKGRLVFRLPGLPAAEASGDDGLRFARKVVMPARPFIGFDADDERDVIDAVAARLKAIAAQPPAGAA
ncbi:MAG: phage virion morphogenesis protein [Proteobacteria bacterium]|nr:phage virion morphogenesis protein [Pseudomonadota bacterium]